ncbi:MAG: branched-chain amino acid ABC transporter permease [Christensenellales bacterium]
MLERILISIPYGIIQGGAYGAIALGLSVIFGVTRITNFAHGALLMMSTFLYYELYTIFGIDPYLGMLVVLPIMYLIGVSMQKFLVTPLLKRERGSTQDPISMLLITLGLGLAIDNLFMMLYGSDYRNMATAASQNNLVVGDAMFVTQWSRVIAFAASFIIAFALWFIINRTELGKKIRAVSQQRDAAAICGVNVYKTYGIAFGLGIAAVGIAGACLSQFYFVQPQIGAVFGTKSFMIVVLGGLGSIPGALLGGLIFGLIETVGGQFMNTTSASMLSFLLFILVLFIRPRGLMGKE